MERPAGRGSCCATRGGALYPSMTDGLTNRRRSRRRWCAASHASHVHAASLGRGCPVGQGALVNPDAHLGVTDGRTPAVESGGVQHDLHGSSRGLVRRSMSASLLEVSAVTFTSPWVEGVLEADGGLGPASPAPPSPRRTDAGACPLHRLRRTRPQWTRVRLRAGPEGSPTRPGRAAWWRCWRVGVGGSAGLLDVLEPPVRVEGLVVGGGLVDRPRRAGVVRPELAVFTASTDA